MSFYNPVIVCGIVGWGVAQIIKFFLNLVHNSSFQLERLYGSGGMPSSHSSLGICFDRPIGRLGQPDHSSDVRARCDRHV